MNATELSTLLQDLLAMSRETEWVEFKHNNYNHDDIGQYISALSNSAALHCKDAAYIVWGVEDQTHRVVGTSFKPRQAKVGNENLENWLFRLLEPRVDFSIHEFEHAGSPVVIFVIQPAFNTPVRFKGTEFVRIGNYRKKLKDYPEKERALWALFARSPFENGIACSDVGAEEALTLIDYPAYFELMGYRIPDDRAGILKRLSKEKIIVKKSAKRYGITNLGAILFSRELSKFERLSRKALRVVVYAGNGRVETIKEQVGAKGYAVGFEGALDYINDQLPQNEQIGRALRTEVRMYPEIAVRELVANALIHQDFSLTGTGPLVEIFSDRIEISNPGTPLIETERFIDEPPQSRNEAVAAFMRRVNICEERGTGIDKVIHYVELFQLPAPDFRVSSKHTQVILFAHRELRDMTREDRIRACYQHACLCSVSNRQMTNSSLRKRFSIEASNSATASRIIRDTLGDGRIKRFDPESSSKKLAKYVPYWA